MKKPPVCPGDHQVHVLSLKVGPASRSDLHGIAVRTRILLTDISRLLLAVNFQTGVICTVPSMYRYRLPGLLGLGPLVVDAYRYLFQPYLGRFYLPHAGCKVSRISNGGLVGWGIIAVLSCGVEIPVARVPFAKSSFLL